MGTRGPEFPISNKEFITGVDHQILLDNHDRINTLDKWLLEEAKPIYNRLLALQEGRKSKEEIEKVKSELLISLLRSGVEPLELNFDTPGLAEKIEARFKILNISFQTMVSSLQRDVINLCVKPLPESIKDNSFRVTVWQDKMYSTKKAFQDFLNNCEVR